jgi:hypothetical protein
MSGYYTCDKGKGRISIDDVGQRGTPSNTKTSQSLILEKSITVNFSIIRTIMALL